MDPCDSKLQESILTGWIRGSKYIRIYSDLRYLAPYLEAWNYRNSCCRAFTWCRSSRLQIFFKIGVLKNFSNFTGKHLCRSLFVVKLRPLRPFLRRYFLENTSSGCFWQWEFWKQCSQETDLRVSQSLKMSTRAEKTQVFKKYWNFARCTCFVNCIMKKHFLLWGKETAFISLFSLWNYFLLRWPFWLRVQF